MATHVGASALRPGPIGWRDGMRATALFLRLGQVRDLAGFSSALFWHHLLGRRCESALRLFAPVAIQYREAIIVAALDLS